MKERTPEQLKGQVRHFATQRGLQPQEVLQMFLLERVLERLSSSRYSKKFILKGGMLISSMMKKNGFILLKMKAFYMRTELQMGHFIRLMTCFLIFEIVTARMKR